MENATKIAIGIDAAKREEIAGGLSRVLAEVFARYGRLGKRSVA